MKLRWLIKRRTFEKLGLTPYDEKPILQYREDYFKRNEWINVPTDIIRVDGEEAEIKDYKEGKCYHENNS